MKFDPMTREKKITAKKELLKSGKYIAVPAVDGRKQELDKEEK